MTLTREPSSRRASQIGEDSSNSTSDLADDPLADVHQLRCVAETDVGELDLAADFDEASRRPIDHDVGDVVAREQRLERTETQNVVADVIEQVFLLGDRQHQILDGDDLVDDVPNFFARAFGVELGQRGKINRLDQGAEDQRLGLKIGLRSSFGLNRRGRSRTEALGCSLATPPAATRGPTIWVLALPLARLPNIAQNPLRLRERSAQMARCVCKPIISSCARVWR